MAFNPYLPSYGAYQNGYYTSQAMASQQLSQPIQQIQQPQVTPTNGLNWVEGTEAARACTVPSNCTVVLFDTKNPVMYIKSADQSGMPSTRTFEIKEIGDTPPNMAGKTDGSGVSREEIASFEDRISALEKQLQGMTAKTKNKAKEAAENESTV